MEEKGLQNYFSKEIKKTEIKYHIKALRNKFKSLNKKIIIKDLFQPDEHPFHQEYGNNKIDVVELFHENVYNKPYFFKNIVSNLLKNNIYINYSTKKEKELDKKTNIYETCIKNLIDGEKEEEKLETKKLDISKDKADYYKYYKIHIEKLNKLKNLGLTQKMNQSQPVTYNPNYNYIKKKIMSCPDWKKMIGRKKTITTGNIPLSLFSTYNRIINLNNNNSSIIKSKKNKKKICKFSNRNIKNHLDKINNNSSIINRSVNIVNSLRLKKISKNKNNTISHGRTQRNYRKLNKQKRNLDNYKSQDKNDEYKKLIQIIMNEPDYHFINYDYTREKVKMMVNYNSHKPNNKRIKEFKGCENGEFLQTLKSFKALKGEKNNGLKFSKIPPRPRNKILPSFMCSVHSRIAFDMTMDESLKLNNYSSGRFTKTKDFYIPRSFNKYINLSLLKSENVQPEKVFNLSEFKYLSNKMLPEIENNIINDKNLCLCHKLK